MRTVRLVALMLGIAIAVGACGSDKKSASTTPAATAPEDRRAPAADVAKGLRELDAIASDIAANVSDKAKATALVEKIEPIWEEIEGTVKANDQDAYVTFEDSFALLKNGAESADATKAQKGAADVRTTVSAYLAKYPG